MKKRLKIGLFLDTFYPAVDGVVVVVDNLAKCLSKDNDVVVVVPYTNTIDTDNKREYKVIRIDSSPVIFTEYRLGHVKTKFSKIYKTLFNEKFDIIHIHSPFTIGRLGQKLARDLNIPCIATMHTRFDFEIRRLVKSEYVVKKVIKQLIKVYNKCDNCIAINKAMIKVFKDYGYKNKPVVIHNGTDLEPISENSQYVKEVKEKYKLDSNIPTLLFVGRIIDVKNIFFILDVLKTLKDNNYKFKMLYVGTGPDYNKLKKKINDYNMDSDIILTGRIMDRLKLSAIYKASDLFLFPSIFDASSLVQIEAAVNETPGLFIENSVTADTIDNNIDGFTCKLDVTTYKNKIIEILSNKKKLKEVSINAKLLLGKSWKDIAEETTELYLKEIKKLKINRR